MNWFLNKLARITVWRFEPKIIAVTGSVGKTATVEKIEAVLKHPVFLSERDNRGATRALGRLAR
ncbi:hypothetical protein HYV91_03440 [Candidatus Wolfebacteria bacterium]|nr:hypothetical protein [Candidatus Wolfebacteria bacterium]